MSNNLLCIVGVLLLATIVALWLHPLIQYVQREQPLPAVRVRHPQKSTSAPAPPQESRKEPPKVRVDRTISKRLQKAINSIEDERSHLGLYERPKSTKRSHKSGRRQVEPLRSVGKLTEKPESPSVALRDRQTKEGVARVHSIKTERQTKDQEELEREKRAEEKRQEKLRRQNSILLSKNLQQTRQKQADPPKPTSPIPRVTVTHATPPPKTPHPTVAMSDYSYHKNQANPGQNQQYHNGGLVMDPLAQMQGPVSEYSLECHNISYIRSFTTGRWHSKIFNPPITAQFLKDVNMEVHAGEVMGVIGSSGSGKTTLLNVIARRVQGTTAGSIIFNQRSMTENAFQKCCAYVSFKQTLLPTLTVRRTLDYQASLTLSSSLSSKEKEERVHSLISEFELTDTADTCIEDLDAATYRRVLVAYHLVRDPILLLVDEPNRHVDSLSSYQLLYNIVQYMKRHNRIAIIATSAPRSDLYQLFDRLTILFFGEVVYSGYTKQMPAYFRQIGYPCPASENPAIYYLSLATVDRETSERYMETQEQAVKLIEIFKGQGEPFSMYAPPGNVDMYNSHHMPLCQLGRPASLWRMFTLAGRTTRSLFGSYCLPLFTRLFSLPLFMLLLTVFYIKLDMSKWGASQTRAGLMFNLMCTATLVAPFVHTTTSCMHRLRYYQESWDGVYGGITYAFSQILANFIVDLIAVFVAAAIVFWGTDLAATPSDEALWVNFIKFGGTIWCLYVVAIMQTMAVMVFVRSGHTAASFVTLVNVVSVIYAGAVLKTYTTYTGTSEYLLYLTYASIHRYASASLNHDYTTNITTNCVPLTDSIGVAPNEFCRWDSGKMYLDEVFTSDVMSDPNYGICYTFVGFSVVATIVMYAVPLPHFVKRKFRFK